MKFIELTLQQEEPYGPMVSFPINEIQWIADIDDPNRVEQARVAVANTGWNVRETRLEILKKMAEAPNDLG